MKKLIFFAVFLFSNLLFSQEKDSLLNAKDARQLTRKELDFAKGEYVKMLKTEDYKRTRKMVAEIVDKSNHNSIPMSSDAEIKEWLTANLEVTNFKSVDEGLSYIQPYVSLRNKLTQDYMHVYELMGKASVEQVGEILEPEFHLTEEELKLKQ